MMWLPSLILGVWTLFSHSTAESAMQEAKHFVVDIISINGEEFVVKDENGKEATIHVGTETEKFGQLQAGDRVDAWIFPNGQAKTLMILRSGALMRAEREQQKQQELQQRAEAQPEQPDLRSLAPGSSVESGHLVRGMMAVLASASLGCDASASTGAGRGRSPASISQRDRHQE